MPTASSMQVAQAAQTSGRYKKTDRAVWSNPRYFCHVRAFMQSGADFEEEIVVVSKAVGHAFDHLDLVVVAFQQAGVQWVATEREDALEIPPQLSREGWIHSTVNSPRRWEMDLF